MHHKLLSSRLLESKVGLDGTTPVNSRIPGENSPVAHPHPKSGAKSALPCGKATKRGKKEAKHVPLDSGLAKIVSLELASDEGSPKKLKQSKTCPRKSKAAALAESNKATLQAMQQQSGQINRTTTPIVAPSSQPISHLHQLPMPLPSNASLLAARLAEEQEAVAMFLHQRQQQSHIHLEQLHLEQMRRMQTAMWLYQHSGSPSGTSLPYLESLIAGRQIPGKLASDMIPQGHLSGVVQLNQSVGYSEPKSSKTVVSTAGASGANPSLLSLAPKRGLEANKEKPIKERPEEYQHLSKKAKRSPLQLAVTVQPSSRSNTDNDYDSDCSDPEKNGHRFRPYQYEQWTEKFQELCDFRKHKGHCQVPHTYKENPPLARWVKRQRYQYKLKVEGKMSTMTDERVQLLENIGFIWDSHAAAWAEKLHELKDYAKQRGDCSVPSTYPENPQLATWVKCQRRQYKLLRDGKTSNMTVDRILELEKVGFVWEVRKTWEHTPNGMERIPAALATPSS